MDLNELEKKIQLYVNEQCRYCRSSSSGVFGFFWVNATFNNISVISWRPVLLVEETGLPGENHRPVVSCIR